VRRRLPLVLTGLIGLVALFLLVQDLATGDAGPDHDPTNEAVQERPNVVVIVTDDQRARGTLRFMPHTQRLFGRRGLSFPNSFATTPMCCPSRATIFTGRYAHNHRVLKGMATDPDFDQRATIQYQLQNASYKTAMFGKYLNGWNLSEDPPHFDSWAVFSQSGDGGYYDGMWNVDGEKRRVGEYSTTFIRNRGVDFIRSHASPDQPWLLFLSTAAPHIPFTPEPRYRGADVGRPESFDPRSIDRTARTKPPFIRKFRDSQRHAESARKRQLRTLLSVDDMVETLYAVLRETDQDRDTLMIFMSDNGYMWGEHGLTRKMFPYDGSVRVPLMIRWPGVTEGGSTDDRLAATIDVAPTIYDATGVPPPEHADVDGRSLLRPWTRDRLLLEYWRTHGRPSWSALRTRGRLYVEYRREKSNKIWARELYDLRSDPRELKNLLHDPGPAAKRHAARLKKRLARDRTCSGVSCP